MQFHWNSSVSVSLLSLKFITNIDNDLDIDDTDNDNNDYTENNDTDNNDHTDNNNDSYW